ncbi:MAG: hypothetical protein CMJ76_07780 [Planctomycetaceae bacterium]|nr:hypothetical protein [Planctomycetaceae bacterium]
MRKIIFAFAVLLFGIQLSLQAAIPRNVKIELDNRFIPAYRTGQLETVILSGSLIANKVSGPLIGEIDIYLGEQNIESLGVILARSRFMLLTQGRQLPPPATVKELILTVPHFQKQVQEVITGTLRPAIMQEGMELPVTLKDFEEALFKVHIYKNDLINLDRTSLLASQAVEYALRTGKVKPVDQEKLSFNFVEARQQIIAENENRVGFELTLRVDRVRLAKRIIEESDELDQLLLAAFAMDQDLKIINDFVQQQRQGLFQSIEAPDIDQINRTGEQAQQNAPRLFREAEMLFTGIHWWIRGRYGKGVAANGLLKGAYVKKNSAAGFALNMPRNRVVATDPFANGGSEESPYVARRHENTWAWENGGIFLKEYKKVKIIAESDYFY